MVKPVEFYMNPQTLESNHYQIEDKEMRKEAILEEAIKEFNNLHDALTRNGVNVTALKGIKGCPDHIFPFLS